LCFVAEELLKLAVLRTPLARQTDTIRVVIEVKKKIFK